MKDRDTNMEKTYTAKRLLAKCREDIPTLSRLGEIIEIERHDDLINFVLANHIIGQMYCIPKKNNVYEYRIRICDGCSILYPMANGWIRKVDWFETSNARLAQYIIFGHKWLVQKAIDLCEPITEYLFQLIQVIAQENFECAYIENELKIGAIMGEEIVCEQNIDYEILDHCVNGTTINIWDSQKGFDETAKKIFVPCRDAYWSIISQI